MKIILLALTLAQVVPAFGQEDPLAIEKQELQERLEAHQAQLDELAAKTIQERTEAAHTLMDSAEWVAKVQKIGGDKVCELEAYVGSLAFNVISAFSLDMVATSERLQEETDSAKAMAEIARKNVRLDLALLAAREENQNRNPLDLFLEALPGSVFYGPAPSNLGNLYELIFEADNKVKMDKMGFDDNGEPIRRIKTGTYAVEVTPAGGVTFTLKLSSEGSEEIQTLEYVLVPDNIGFYYLAPSNAPQDPTKVASPFPAECGE